MLRTLKTIIIFLILIYFPTPLHSQDKANAKALDKMIIEGIKDWHIPGLTTVVVKDQKVVFKKTYGVKNLENKAPIDDYTLFNMGSTTKAIVCMALGVLVDQGKLAWTDKVRKHLSSFQLSDSYITEEARIQDLLTHNLGIAEADLLWTLDSVSTKNTISRFKYAQKIYPLRGGYEYNNLMYAVAGEVIGSVSGMHWTEFVKQYLLDPLEMNHTKTKASEIFDTGNYVTPYLNDIEDGIVEVKYNLSDQIGAAGMIWSCANDIQNYLQFLTNDGVFKGNRILEEETFNYLFKPHTLIPNAGFYPTQNLTNPKWISYGLGWFQHDYRGEKIDFHTGSIEGLIAIAGIIHDKNTAVYVFGNMDHAELRHAILYQAFDLFVFNDRTLNWHHEIFSLYEKYRNEAIQANKKRKEARVLNTKTTLELKNYAGEYKNEMLGTIQISIVDNKLKLNCNNFLKLTASHWHFDSFLSEENNRFKMKLLFNFHLNPKGRIEELLFMGNKFRKVTH